MDRAAATGDRRRIPGEGDGVPGGDGGARALPAALSRVRDPIQRIRYAENETNYCPVCQTEGRLLADRGLSRLLRQDWPRSLEEMDERLKS